MLHYITIQVFDKTTNILLFEYHTNVTSRTTNRAHYLAQKELKQFLLLDYGIKEKYCQQYNINNNVFELLYKNNEINPFKHFNFIINP